ncbi:chemotaxis protein CheW [Fuchsiella alkaliacetigena]|uniref:chemotaxis protein CheW n=1 Tax=Fuchsiella alkaliacetigena TaxID=957042 RepID=UPI002009E2D8|nr:chemotaxis protein CheW [Fuchsiella alkaliacetigena]MCK8823891.1 chemotaxis protein CheW [Fuchsiella alkaliacetigena]
MDKKSRNLEDNALNILNQQLTNISAENQYVTFQIDEETYGIDIMLVQEIIRYNEPTKVFNANPIIRGLINFRGQVIPVIDMRRKFNLAEQDYDKFTVIIVFEVQDKTMGIIVDRVSDIMSFSDEEIQMVDKEFAEDIKTEHLKGIAKSDDDMALILDPTRILSFEELEKLAEQKQDELEIAEEVTKD